METAHSPHLSNKKKFVTNLTLKRHSKYAETDFLTPIKTTKPKRKRSTKPKPSPESVKSNRSKTQDEEPVEQANLPEVDPNTKRETPIFEIDTSVEIDEKELYTNDLRNLVLFLGMERQLKEKKMPNWAKLAIASTYQSNGPSPG
jgi:hypothetical protein